jgi:signal transduction histidine kinase
MPGTQTNNPSVEEFQKATEDLYKQNLEIVKLNKKLADLTHELETANEKLKGLDKLKTEFLSLASHQLRTPLTAIKGYASMLFEGSFGKLDEKQSDAVKRIYTSAQGLVNVVEDLLNVSKIEQGGMKYEFSPVDLSALVTQLYGEMKVPAETKKLDLSLEMDQHDKFIVSADATKLKQVFLNLTDNSIKYTPKGFVKISLKREGGNIIFAVSDNGMGISAETRAKLFEKFSRGEGGKTNTGGSGLGLYLAQQIARAHKGDITIESEGLGKGSSFIVTLPASGTYPN